MTNTACRTELGNIMLQQCTHLPYLNVVSVNETTFQAAQVLHVD